MEFNPLALLGITTPTPRFDPDSDRVEDWLIAFETVHNGIPDDRKIEKLFSALQGRAWIWLCTQIRCLGINLPWDQLKDALKKEYGTSEMLAFHALADFHQSPDEDIVAYIHRVSSACSLANPSMREVEKINYILRGMSPDTRRNLMLMQPTTVPDLIQKIRLLEMIPESSNFRFQVQQRTLAILAAPAVPVPVTTTPDDPKEMMERLEMKITSLQEEVCLLRAASTPLHDGKARVLSDERRRSCHPDVNSNSKKPRRGCHRCKRRGHHSSTCTYDAR